MGTQTQCAEEATLGGALGGVPESWPESEVLTELEAVEPLTVPAIAETAEAVIENLDAPFAAAPALLDRLVMTEAEGDAPTSFDTRDSAAPLVLRVRKNRDTRSFVEGTVVGTEASEARAICLDEYAKAVLYNGLGHYQAARFAAQRACERDDFSLLDGALAELVEASVRSGSRGCAVAALRRLEARAQVGASSWARGIAACSRALLNCDEEAESSYAAAIELLAGTPARVALGRACLLYGEWLRRQGRRVDAREQLALAHRVFSEVGLGGFAERARRELLATGHTVRKRTDDTRFDLTPQEAEIAQLAARGRTNPEIGERLFISPRTVEWHLRKVFTKLGIRSRRELSAIFLRRPHIEVSA